MSTENSPGKMYVIVLAYNEEKNLRSVLSSIAENLSDDFTIVVVNDGSTDATKQIVLDLAESCHTVCLDHEVNKGVGAAFRTGLSYTAQHGQPEDIVITMEADGTSDTSILPQMKEKIAEEYDIVCASRYRRGGGYKNFPFYRLVLSMGANTLMSIFFHTKNVRDFSLFYRAYRNAMLQKAFDHYGEGFITSKSFAANAEILVKIRKLGCHAGEVPVCYNYGSKKRPSHMRIAKTAAEYFRLVGKKLCGRL